MLKYNPCEYRMLVPCCNIQRTTADGTGKSSDVTCVESGEVTSVSTNDDNREHVTPVIINPRMIIIQI